MYLKTKAGTTVYLPSNTEDAAINATVNDETPEWTDEIFAQARPAAQVLPPELLQTLIGMNKRARGAQKTPTKQS